MGSVPGAHVVLANALTIRAPGLLVTLACFLLSVGQRRLSTPVRTLRRRTVSVSGFQTLDDGTVLELSREQLAGPLDGALRAIALALVLLATGLVILRL